MNELKVIEKDGIQTVSARQIFEGLGIAERFSKWFERMCSYGFESDNDFTSVPFSTVVNNGGIKEIGDYAVSIDMAKQICMLQRSDKGKQYREYLIKVEKAWNAPEAVIERGYELAKEQLSKVKEQLFEQKQKIEVLAPQAQIANDFIDRNHLTNFRDASNILQIKQSDFMKILAEKYVYKNSIGEYRCYAEYSKYFALRPFQKGIEKTGQQLMLTLEGLEFFKSKIFTEVKQ